MLSGAAQRSASGVNPSASKDGHFLRGVAKCMCFVVPPRKGVRAHRLLQSNFGSLLFLKTVFRSKKSFRFPLLSR